MAKTKIRSADVIADELEQIRWELAEAKKAEGEKRLELLAALHKEQRDSAGNYKISKAKTFSVAVEELALPFAIEHGLTKIDVAKAHKVFQLSNDLRFADITKYGFEEVWQERVVPLRGGVEEE